MKALVQTIALSVGVGGMILLFALISTISIAGIDIIPIELPFIGRIHDAASTLNSLILSNAVMVFLIISGITFVFVTIDRVRNPGRQF